MPYSEAYELVRPLRLEQYLETVCDCEVCQNLLRGSVAEDFNIYGELETHGIPPIDYQTQTKRSIEASRLHFAVNRFRELQVVKTSGTAALVQQFRETEARLRNYMTPRSLNHLRIWIEALS